MAIHILMMVVTYCRPGEHLQSMREDLIKPMHGVTSDWSLLLHPVQRSVLSKTQSYDDTIDLKNHIYLDHQSGCSPDSPPSFREDLRVPTRRFHQRVSGSNTGTGTGKYCSVSVPPFWSVAGQSGTAPHNAGDQKTRMVEVRQQHCPVRKIWKTGTVQSDLSKSQLTYFEARDLALEELLFRRHRVEDVLRPSLTVAASS